MALRFVAAGIVAACLAGSAHAAGPVGPAVTVKQIAPPKTLVTGVKTLQVTEFSGLMGPEVTAQVKAAYADQERLKTDAAAIGKEALAMGTDMAAQYVGGLVGGGLQGKLVEGLTKNTVKAVQDAVDAEPLVLESGLAINPFTVVDEGADAVLSGSIQVADNVESFTQKQQKRDGEGNPVTNSEGKPVMIEVSCKRRSVEVTLNWAIRGATETTGDVVRKGGDSRCGSDVSNLADANSIATALLGNAGDAIVRDLAPAWRVRKLQMNKSKTAKDALVFVRKSDWDSARCGFRAAADANPSDSDALFGHGVLLEAFGHFDAAVARYDQAIAVKDKKPYHHAKERLAKRQAEIASMTQAYGLTWTIPPEPAGCD